MVFGPGRKPVPQIPVELLDELNSVVQRTKTDQTGRYSFNRVPSGRFAVKVMPLGTNLEEQVQETQVATMAVDGRADHIQLDFELRERRSRDNRLGSTGTVFVQDIPVEARKLYDAALSDLGAKKAAAGETNLQDAIRIFPNYYDALTRLGLLGIELKKFDMARDSFSRAVAVNDRSFTAWYGLSYADFALNKISTAIPEAEKALELDKTSVDVYLLLGIMQRRLKDYSKAEKSLLQAKKLDNGKNPDINWNLALLYAHNLNNYAAAAAELETYLKILPTAPNKSSIEKLIKQFREKAQAKST
jgi:tetratricopeptide (TPR) repeat protein